ncbi:MAG TPA: DUF1653 domain-containing protein [Chlamydiales bacterium]|nr:DUF1653 domain-containing protein [Chlamydiales bacterium]
MDVKAKLATAKKKVKAGEKYVHYKSPEKPYTILNVALLEADTEPCVVYESAEDDNHGDKLVWVRPFSSFFAEVETDGKMVSRFKKV